MEQGIIPWRKKWNTMINEPKNFVTKKDYNGFNHFFLQIRAMFWYYKTNYWITYNQARQLNGNIKKGEKGTTIVYWIVKEEENIIDGVDVSKTLMYPKAHTVFNLDQTEGIDYEIEERETKTEIEKDEICQKIVDEMQQKPLIYETLPKQIFFKL